MFWNEHVSINTFVFGIFCLILIAYNNAYSTYKIGFFKNGYTYLFMLSFLLMQLIEFFLWRNLNHVRINHLFSRIGYLLICIQPICSLFLIDNIPLRNMLLLVYSIPTSIFMTYNFLHTNIHTVLSPSGHLAWRWTSYNEYKYLRGITELFYLIFLFFSFVYNEYYILLGFLLMYMIYTYYLGKDGSQGSIWCLSINMSFLYFLIMLLVILPFREIKN